MNRLLYISVRLVPAVHVGCIFLTSSLSAACCACSIMLLVSMYVMVDCMHICPISLCTTASCLPCLMRLVPTVLGIRPLASAVIFCQKGLKKR